VKLRYLFALSAGDRARVQVALDLYAQSKDATARERADAERLRARLDSFTASMTDTDLDKVDAAAREYLDQLEKYPSTRADRAFTQIATTLAKLKGMFS